MSTENIWKDFAQLNGMSQEEFSNEIILAAMSVMSLKLDKGDSNCIKITQGNYVLTLLDKDK